MDGWGAEDWFSAASGGPGTGSSGFTLTSSQAAMFFSPTSGIGLEILRTGNYYCPLTGTCAVTPNNVPDLVTLQEAVANGARIEVNIQPPANLKYIGNFVESTPDPSTGLCIDSANWSAFATYTVQWLQMLAANGVPVSFLSVANEPDQPQDDTLGGCVWTAAGLDSYIGGYLGPGLSSAGLSSIKVMMAETSDWFNTDLVSTCLDDPTCSQYVSIAAGHDYGLGGVDGTNNGFCCATATVPPSSTNGKHVWQTETGGGFTVLANGDAWDPSIADALVWAHNIHDFLTISNVSGWEYWELIDACGGVTTNGCSGGPFNDGLTISTGGGQTPTSLTTSQRMYVMGNWSKFVRSGWVRIGATPNPAAGVFVTAFNQTSSGGFTIVAINNNSSDTAVTFSLSGFPTSPSSVTPWITSSTLSLAQQSNSPVSQGSFVYTLPGYSVTSFVGDIASISAPTPPTKLTSTVQ
jgi:O-glycosyl hydrolase